MTTSMGPPPPRSPITASSTGTHSEEASSSSSAAPVRTPMGPPSPVNPNPPRPDSVQLPNTEHLDESRSSPPHTDSNPADNASETDCSEKTEDTCTGDKNTEGRPNFAVPYTIPPWSGPPEHKYYLEVLKDGAIIDQLAVYEKGAYMFGRVDICDFLLEHPTISRFHAVLQLKRSGDAYLYDLGSTHGTFVNKNQVKKKVYVDLHVGDVIRFGLSSRLYIFQGPTELMPPERDLKAIRKAKIREEMEDMEASLLRAKLEASVGDGVSWGMRDDAIEENEDEIDEITWQTFKGKLTEKQEKTHEKVLKRLGKITHMKKEIDAIRAKDISQGGLTQGQQTQIARNEQRISQLMEELENLEETLNESIRESLGARSQRTSRGGKRATDDDEGEEYLSDEDEFYDRTKKFSKQKSGENQSVETADSLIDKRDAIIKEIEDKKGSLLEEDDKMSSESVAEADALDAYMSGLSSQLAIDKKDRLREELSTLQLELDRIMYLLKIADPTGEASRKRESKVQETKLDVTKVPSPKKEFPYEENKRAGTEQKESENVKKQVTVDAPVESSEEEAQEQKIVASTTDGKKTSYAVVKPKWLGATEDIAKREAQQEELPTSMPESDQFVDYKDRSRMLEKEKSTEANLDSNIENAAPGLIIRKRKSDVNRDEDSLASTPATTDISAEDAIALLLKHSKGYHESDDGMKPDDEDVPPKKQSGKGNKKPKKVLGPERPSFLGGGSDYESWVPPKGQSGDGRTSLNDRYGY